MNTSSSKQSSDSTSTSSSTVRQRSNTNITSNEEIIESYVSRVHKIEASVVFKEKLEQHIRNFKLDEPDDDDSANLVLLIVQLNLSKLNQHQIKVVDRILLNMSVVSKQLKSFYSTYSVTPSTTIRLKLFKLQGFGLILLNNGELSL
ncbi:unnamed protein product [Rotaria magnacalcarata]|uniref:Uncharacterized protein n=1 Tax=Rotaria magnacalcarata TaxID=392030 RepID=A0A816YR96_9BILA|nr:unnamed protein product [Rotaria magnacalcarata]